MKELIKSLVEMYGPTGSEGPVREWIAGQLKGHVDAMSVDAMGNLIATVRGKGGGKRVMLAAHMDEIGLIVTHVDEKGFARISDVGGVRPLGLWGGRVRFADGRPGVIGVETKRLGNEIPRLDQFFIDTGADSRATSPVTVGDVACFDRPFVDMGDRLVSKAMDDRVGCAVLMQTIFDLGETPHEVSFCFTVQEEVGMRGARTAAFGVEAEVGIAVDVTRTGDTPETQTMEVALGNGPAIKVKDSGIITHPGLRRLMVDTARQAGLPYQMEVLEGGATDGTAMQVSRAGMPVGVMSIPTRYVHMPSEMVDYRDVTNGVRLLVELLRTPIAV
jgi:tetrahedral aminopeptidase